MFITNQPTKNLGKRIGELVLYSKELKFLTAFFYFSGFAELYESLKRNKEVRIKILVGLDIDTTSETLLVEYASTTSSSVNEKLENYFSSLKKVFLHTDFDKREVYEQAKFFVDLIKNERLHIRKTVFPNHAKLYIFLTKEDQAIDKILITGSSNLTRAGLSRQEEFNVELGAGIVEYAEQYFDSLWNGAIEITENPIHKERLLKIIEEETPLKTITPFEAFILVLKSYLDTYRQKDIGSRLIEIFKKNGYKPYSYQLDAIRQALAILEEKNGVILADVVGLGKTVMACAIARELGKRGVIICPPGLMGDPKTKDDGGWNMYKEQFGLYDWEVWSTGELEKLHRAIKKMRDIEVVIVDEAHRFRNEDTQNYEYLKNICMGRKVILLTATPFNNRPSDILSLIKLFSPSKKSPLTLDGNLGAKFASFQEKFRKINFILKNYRSTSKDKLKRVIECYKALIGEEDLDIKRIEELAHKLSKEIRSIIEPVTIRRNRLDLIKNPRYKEEVKNLSIVEDPQEWFYELTPEQLSFYDRVIKEYFASPEEGGKFKGAIYQPFVYERGLLSKRRELEEALLQQEENREFIQQRNLYDFMRRLLVKRFESSFGAFEQSIRNFLRVTEAALQFIERTNKFILDRNFLMKVFELEGEEIEKELLAYREKLEKMDIKRPKRDKVYNLGEFIQKDEFIADIKSDIYLFRHILAELQKLKLKENDPKIETLSRKLAEELSKPPLPGEPRRKIVIFSEYIDTVTHVGKALKGRFDKVMVVDRDLSRDLICKILENFDASYPNPKDDYDILVTSDRLSEGFNLNRAGMVINYDIPWNPVRIIQRLGRINRISRKVFEKLYVVNFFPTQKGAEIVKAREIAQQKMFLIHKVLGEDSKILAPEEEPTPSRLYSKLMQNPEKLEEESFYTKVYKYYQAICSSYPQIENLMKKMPSRVKVAKNGEQEELLVFIKKANTLYVRKIDYKNDMRAEDISLEEAFEKIKCSPKESPLDWNTDRFWEAYKIALNSFSQGNTYVRKEQSIESKAYDKISALLDLIRKNELTLTQDEAWIKGFLESLREDIVDYGFLSKPTLRTIKDMPLNDKEKLINLLRELSENLGGPDYLKKEKQRIERIDRKIIVAIENKTEK